jgi:hypothetical protein
MGATSGGRWALRALAALVLGLVGLGTFLHVRQPTACLMTYSWPVYEHVPTPASRLAFKYRLWRYLHGGARVQHVADKAVLPVLYVPGHQGSYQQARSLCSTLAEKHADAPIECWTADFGDERTALLGHAMWQQAEFVNDAVATIRQAQEQRQQAAANGVDGSSALPPPGVVIVAHSLGGAAARGALTAPNHAPGSISAIVTLGTPHTGPPVNLDAEAQRFYSAINGALAAAVGEGVRVRAAQRQCVAGGKTAGVCTAHSVSAGWGGVTSSSSGSEPLPPGVLEHADVALLSIGSGGADTQIWESLTRVTDVVDDARLRAQRALAESASATLAAAASGPGFKITVSNATSSAASAAGEAAGAAALARHHGRLPIAWLSTSSARDVAVTIDHAAVVWCKQLVGLLATGIATLAKQPPPRRRPTHKDDAHARLHTLVAAIDDATAGPLAGGERLDDATSPMELAPALFSSPSLPRAAFNWLFLSPLERAHLRLHGPPPPVVLPHGAAAPSAAARWAEAAQTYLASAPVRFGPALVVSAVVLTLLAAAARAARLSAQLSAALTKREGGTPLADAADALSGPTPAYDVGALFKASMLASLFAGIVGRRVFRSRNAQRFGVMAALAVVVVSALPALGVTKYALALVSTVWAILVEPAVPFGIAIVCGCVAIGALDAATEAVAACRGSSAAACGRRRGGKASAGNAPAAATPAAASSAAAPSGAGTPHPLVFVSPRETASSLGLLLLASVAMLAPTWIGSLARLSEAALHGAQLAAVGGGGGAGADGVDGSSSSAYAATFARERSTLAADLVWVTLAAVAGLRWLIAYLRPAIRRGGGGSSKRDRRARSASESAPALALRQTLQEAGFAPPPAALAAAAAAVGAGRPTTPSSTAAPDSVEADSGAKPTPAGGSAYRRNSLPSAAAGAGALLAVPEAAAAAAAYATPHSTCRECFHEDGGRDATLEDTTAEMMSTPPAAASDSAGSESAHPEQRHVTSSSAAASAAHRKPVAAAAAAAASSNGLEDPAADTPPRTLVRRQRVVEVAPGVWLGPTFRVVACNCWSRVHANPALAAATAAASGRGGDERLLRAAVCDFCACRCAECAGHPEAAALSRGSGGGAGGDGADCGADGTGSAWDACAAAAAWTLAAVATPTAALLRFVVSGTGDASLDAAVLALAAGVAASTISMLFLSDAAHARDVVVALAALTSGCVQTVVRAAAAAPTPAR